MGKSTLIKAFLGREFRDLDSTVGIEANMYEVNKHHIQDDCVQWNKYDPKESSVLWDDHKQQQLCAAS